MSSKQRKHNFPFFFGVFFFCQNKIGKYDKHTKGSSNTPQSVTTLELHNKHTWKKELIQYLLFTKKPKPLAHWRPEGSRPSRFGFFLVGMVPNPVWTVGKPLFLTIPTSKSFQWSLFWSGECLGLSGMIPNPVWRIRNGRECWRTPWLPNHSRSSRQVSRPFLIIQTGFATVFLVVPDHFGVETGLVSLHLPTCFPTIPDWPVHNKGSGQEEVGKTA